MADENETQTAEGAPAAKPDAPKFMTADEFNKASTAREKRLLDKIGEMIKASQPKVVEEPADDEDEDEAVEASDEADEADEKPAKKPAAAPAPVKPSKAEIAAKKALAKATAVEKAAKERELTLQKEKADLQAKQERTEILSSLSDAGAVQAQHALAVLKATNRIKRNDDGELVFVAQREVAGEKFEEEVALDEGVKEWLTTDEGKIYAPPKGAEGSGAGPSGKTGKGKSMKELSKTERKKAAGQALMKWAMTRG